MDLINSFYQYSQVMPMQVMGMPLIGLTFVTMGLVGISQMILSLPAIKSLLNTSLVFLNNTREVWKPLVDSSLIVLKPLAGVLSPIIEVSLIFAEVGVRGMIILGYVTVLTMKEVYNYAVYFLNATRAAGLSFTSSLENAFLATKDFTGAVVSLLRGFSYITIHVIKSGAYIVNSFETVSDFLYQFFFYPHTVTWSDVYNITFPFMIVATILGYVFWRSYSVLLSPSAVRQEPLKMAQNDEIVLRRSPRIARKRALLSCQDLQSFSGEKTSSRTAYL